MSATSQNAVKFALALLGMVFLLNVVETTDPSTPKPDPVLCQNADPVSNFNYTLFDGVWFEAARKTNPLNNESCNALNFLENKTVISTYNTIPGELWINQSQTFELTFNEGIGQLKNNDGSKKIFKILKVDYKSYAFVCSYYTNTTQMPEAKATSTTTQTSSTEPSASTLGTSTAITPQPITTAEAYILVRNRLTNAAVLTNLENSATTTYPDFQDLTIVIQSENCTGNGSGSLVPMLTLIMAVILFNFIKF